MTQTGKPFKRILMTGAAGGLGKVLRDRIKPWAEIVRLSDIADMGEARPGEELVQCDLSDKAAVMKLMEGVDAVLHFGGISTEAPFEAIMQANILGVANLYEAAYKQGVKRLMFASSNHAIGYYKTTDMLDANMPTRPDSMYGISKVFGEQMSRYYYDRFGMETVCIRIGSSFPQPANKRMMSTYLSYDDLTELLRCSCSHRALVIPSCSACRTTIRSGGITVMRRTWATGQRIRRPVLRTFSRILPTSRKRTMSPPSTRAVNSCLTAQCSND